MTSPTRLFLIRHGEVPGEGVLHGHVDVPLTAAGEQQLRRVAEQLAAEPLAAVYCSDLQRAHRSAEIVVGKRRLPLFPDPSFRELDMGEWDGLPLAQVWRDDRRRMQQWWEDLEFYTLPGGESMRIMGDRVMERLQRVLDHHRGETIALIAHGGTNRVVLFEAMGLSLSRFHSVGQDYGCVNRIDYFQDGRSVVQLING